MSPIFLFGEKYFDVYTIEAGREATAQARFPGGTWIVEQLLHPQPQWLNVLGRRHNKLKFGKRISLGITNREEGNAKYVFADAVSVAFRENTLRPNDSSDRPQENLGTAWNERRLKARIGFYSLPNVTEGDLDRRHHGKRFPGLGSLFQAHLIRCLATIDPTDSGRKLFDAIFKAGKDGIKACEEYRAECLQLLQNVRDEADLAKELRRHNKGTITGKLPFNPKPLPIGSYRSNVLYACDYGDLTESLCDKVRRIDEFSYLLYRSSHLGSGSYAYKKLITLARSSKTKLVIVAKADHLRGFGVRLNPYDWFQATANLIGALEEAIRADPQPHDGGGSSLRDFLFHADLLVIRFGLEGFALVQKADPKEQGDETEEDHTVMIEEALPTRSAVLIR